MPPPLCTDWHAVCLQDPTEKQLRAGPIIAATQFGQMRKRLGRVARNHGTHQDRLVNKLRRMKAGTYAAAGDYLERACLADHIRRFTHPAASPEDYHRAAPTRAGLDAVFRLESGRVIGNDWLIRGEERFLQLQRQWRRDAPAKAKVVVCESEDGRLEIHRRGHEEAWEEIAERPRTASTEPAHKVTKPYGGTPPTANHRW
jgi:hypothetical protein